MVEIEVFDVRGRCPVYSVGDKIVVDDPEIVLEETDALCTHALPSLLHHVVALERGADPVELGLSKTEERIVNSGARASVAFILIALFLLSTAIKSYAISRLTRNWCGCDE